MTACRHTGLLPYVVDKDKKRAICWLRLDVNKQPRRADRARVRRPLRVARSTEARPAPTTDTSTMAAELTEATANGGRHKAMRPGRGVAEWHMLPSWNSLHTLLVARGGCAAVAAGSRPASSAILS